MRDLITVFLLKTRTRICDINSPMRSYVPENLQTDLSLTFQAKVWAIFVPTMASSIDKHIEPWPTFWRLLNF